MRRLYKSARPRCCLLEHWAQKGVCQHVCKQACVSSARSVCIRTHHTAAATCAHRLPLEQCNSGSCGLTRRTTPNHTPSHHERIPTDKHKTSDNDNVEPNWSTRRLRNKVRRRARSARLPQMAGSRGSERSRKKTSPAQVSKSGADRYPESPSAPDKRGVYGHDPPIRLVAAPRRPYNLRRLTRHAMHAHRFLYSL